MHGLLPSGADSFFHYLFCTNPALWSWESCLPSTAAALLDRIQLDAALSCSKMSFIIYACVKFWCMLQYLCSKHKFYYREVIPCTSPPIEESESELGGRMHPHLPAAYQTGRSSALSPLAPVVPLLGSEESIGMGEGAMSATRRYSSCFNDSNPFKMESRA